MRNKAYSLLLFAGILSILVPAVVLTVAVQAGESGETSYIIVHALNPEGIEIASIEGMDTHCVEIYDGDTLIGYGAYNSATHNQPITISTGSHTIKVKFNGMTMEQSINISEGETQTLIFTFTRTEYFLEDEVRAHEPSGWAWETNIPSQDFPTWFTQGIATCTIEDGGMEITLLWGLSPQYSGGVTVLWYSSDFSYHFHSISANITYTGVVYRLENNSISWTIKMSSVPYDLLGTGVGKEENQPPVASFTYSPENPMVGGNIIFDASESYDPDGTIISYEWDFGDGHSENLTVPVVPHVFETPDVYPVTLTVADNDGLTSFASKEINLTLKNGDLILCRSYKSIIPNVDFWTHIGIYVEQSNQIVEALERGVVATPLAEWSWVGKNGRNETCVRALRVKTDDSTRDKAVNFALAQIGKSYDFGSLFINKKQEAGECSLCKKWYCSELVWAAYLSASNGQINLDQDEKGLVSPDDINKDNDVEMIGEHKEAIPQRVYWNILWGEAHSPVDLEITDPHGFTLTKQHSEILGATYDEVDIDADGETEDLFVIPNPKVGQYLINVIPEPNALPTDTYTLEATVDGQTMVLAQDVQIQDIPSQPYEFESKLNPADFDNDGDVDFYDYAAFASRWMSANCHYPDWCEGKDLDYSGLVDFMDLSIFTENWLWEKIPADFDIDGDVDFVDYTVFANHWMKQDCAEPNWCSGADLDKSGSVDLFDLAEFAELWLEGL